MSRAQWDYVVYDGRVGLITMDLGAGMYRVSFHHGPARTKPREVTVHGHEVVPATEEQKAEAVAAGLTREAERSWLPQRPRAAGRTA
ncbi:hypothetical protein AB0903_08325 [Streptomyces sp. NPDC048389]|uniref:hypothetical protein n=1 Tax=Streptomyces sp. NPDC048389 TaxID=3154622 RepID=UPI0034559193